MANRVLLLKSFENHRSRIKSFISKFSCSLNFSPFDPVSAQTSQNCYGPILKYREHWHTSYPQEKNTSALPAPEMECCKARDAWVNTSIPEVMNPHLAPWRCMWGLSFSPVKRRWVAASVTLGEKNSEGKRFALLHPKQPVNNYRKHLRKASGQMTGEAARSTSSCENTESNSHSRYQRKKEDSWR